MNEHLDDVFRFVINVLEYCFPIDHEINDIFMISQLNANKTDVSIGIGIEGIRSESLASYIAGITGGSVGPCFSWINDDPHVSLWEVIFPIENVFSKVS